MPVRSRALHSRLPVGAVGGPRSASRRHTEPVAIDPCRPLAGHQKADFTFMPPRVRASAQASPRERSGRAGANTLLLSRRLYRLAVAAIPMHRKPPKGYRTVRGRRPP